MQVVYAELLMLGAEIVEATESALEAGRCLSRAWHPNPQVLAMDGLHIAVATVGEASVLVSWNFKHIVHCRRDTHRSIRGESGVRLQTVVDLQPAGGDNLWQSKKLMPSR